MTPKKDIKSFGVWASICWLQYRRLYAYNFNTPTFYILNYNYVSSTSTLHYWHSHILLPSNTRTFPKNHLVSIY
jgi:hypothetical protein